MSQLLDRASKLFGMHEGPPPDKAFWDRIPLPSASAVRKIRAAIEQSGSWEEKFEWRIMTVTTSRIEPRVMNGRTWYRVHVECGHEFVCDCPTLERAVEFEIIYRALLCDLFHYRGWPSWASKESLDPPAP